MAQHDYVIANGTGAAVRSDLNNGLAAIVSNNSGATEPATMYAYQWWADTTTGLLKLRNSANSAWISLRELDGTLTIEDGTAAAPGLAFTSDLNTGLFRVGADQLAITTGGTSRLAVSTTAISSTLAVDVPLGAVGTPSITFTGDVNTGLFSPGADTVALVTGGAQRATIDSSGRLLVGTSTARSDFFNTTSFAPRLQVEGTDFSTSMLSVTCNATGANTNLVLARSRGTANGAVTVVADGDTLGSIQFQGADGTDLVSGASIAGVVDGTPGANDMPGRIVFSTTADGAASPTERIRITQAGATIYTASSGSVTLGNTDTAFLPDGGFGQYLWLGNTYGSGKTYVEFTYNGTAIGKISANSTSSVAYATSSDYRLKENVEPITGAVARILQLKPSRFNFKVDPDHTVDGFIAHEAQAVVPECVTGEKDAVDDDGNPVMQGIDQSKLVPLLTAALQEAITEINALKDRLTAAGIA